MSVLTHANKSPGKPGRLTLLKLLEHSRHRRVESVRGYVAEADRFDDHAGEALLRDTNRDHVGDHVIEQIGVGGLVEQSSNRHPVIGHRVLFGES